MSDDVVLPTSAFLARTGSTIQTQYDSTVYRSNATKFARNCSFSAFSIGVIIFTCSFFSGGQTKFGSGLDLSLSIMIREEGTKFVK